MKKPLVLLLLLGYFFCAFANNDSTKYKVISMEDAIHSKKVKCIFTGSYDPGRSYNITDGSGLHFGKCMDAIIESQLDTFFVLELDAGYSLIPEDSTLQMMFVTKTVEFPVYPNTTIPFSIYAMCGEINKKPPYAGDKYQLGVKADSILGKVIRVIEKEYLQNIIGQHMMWAVTNQASKEELTNYGADSISLKKTVSILTDNKIDCGLVREGNPTTPIDEKPAFVKVSRYADYFGQTRPPVSV